MKSYNPSMNAAIDRLCVSLFPNGTPQAKSEQPKQMAPLNQAYASECGFTVFHECLGEELAAGEPINYTIKLPWPPDLVTVSGEALQPCIIVRSTDEGDVLLALEGDQSLAGRSLQICDSLRPIVLNLRNLGGKAFAVASLTEAEYNTIITQCHGKLSGEWR